MPSITTTDDAYARALPGLSPKGLIEALDNPEIIKRSAVGDLYVVLGRFREAFRSRAMTQAQEFQYAQLLLKISGITAQDEQPLGAANLPRIVINIPNYGPDQWEHPARRPVLEHAATGER